MNNFKAYRWHCGTLYLLHRYNVPQTQVISGFLLTFITSIYSFLIYFETFFYDYYVNYPSNHNPKLRKAPNQSVTESK